MKYNPFSRRMFLVGTGHTLFSIPLLTSLLPKEALAQATSKPLRFIMITNGNSPNAKTFFGQTNFSPAALNLMQTPGNLLMPTVNYAPLSKFAGDLSYILQPFTPYKDRLALIRGMDVLAPENGAHPPSYPSAAAGYALVPGRHTSTGQLSIDAIIATKTKRAGIAENAKQMILYPRYSGGIGSSGNWNQKEESATFDLNAGTDGTDARRVVRRTSMTMTASLLQRFFQVGAAPIADGLKRGDLLNQVYQDYSQVRGNPRLSAEDRKKLDAYMSLVSEIEMAEKGGSGSMCGVPALENDMPPPTTGRAAVERWIADVRAVANPILYRNQIKIIIAAFACDLTRVASYGLGGLGSHDYHHGSSFQSHQWDSSEASKANYLSHLNASKIVVQLMAGLDSFREDGQSLLDNSILYWNQAYGTTGGHSKRNFPVLLAGGAGGKLRMGNYYDYNFVPQGQTASRGLPLNNLLVTIMSCYGITPADYEFKPEQGYGDYSNGLSFPAELRTITAKRMNLPFLFRG